MSLQGLEDTQSLSCLFQQERLSLFSGTLGLTLSWINEGTQAEASFPWNVTETNLLPTQVDLPHPGAWSWDVPPFTRTKASVPHKALWMSVEKEARLQGSSF